MKKGTLLSLITAIFMLVSPASISAQENQVCFCHNIIHNPVTICTTNQALIRAHNVHVRIGFDSLGACSNPTPTTTPTPQPTTTPTSNPTLPPPTPTPKTVVLSESSTNVPNPPEFPSCHDLLDNPGDWQHHQEGFHQIVGNGLVWGSDDVYSLPDRNFVQCYCPPEGGEGIQTNWWQTSIQQLAGWFSENGLQWNLGDQHFLAQNQPFECPSNVPTPTPTPPDMNSGSVCAANNKISITALTGGNKTNQGTSGFVRILTGNSNTNTSINNQLCKNQVVQAPPSNSNIQAQVVNNGQGTTNNIRFTLTNFLEIFQ